MRIVAHLDMDAFFAAVEERERPHLAGRPIVVGADPQDGRGRGVVSTANYAARKYGIYSAMPISTAWRLAEEARRRGEPTTAFITPDFGRYSETSERIMAIIARALERACPPNFPSGRLERASVDEAYFDLSFAENYRKAEELCRAIKEDIRKQKRLTCSIGIGPNKLIAKIASDRQKPDGLTIVRPDKVRDFLAPLPICVIPGVGPKTEQQFESFGVRTVQHAQKFSREEMIARFGKWGAALYDKVRGEDDLPVVEEYEVKSIGEQETFFEDSSDAILLTERLKELCVTVFRRFAQGGFKTFRTVVLTVRFADFETVSRSHTLTKPARDLKTLEFEALKLFLPFLDKRENPQRKKVRLLGIRVEKLDKF